VVTSVAVLGGGVGGLSAAHELATRGFDVVVYEARDEFGGKARSIPAPEPGTDGRAPLPGEHGFRFFPGFYRHINETMAEIPYHHGSTVADNLVGATQMLLAQDHGQNEIVAPTNFPSTLGDLGRLARFVHTIAVRMKIPLHEYVLFFNQLLSYLTACDERRLAEFEPVDWWTFVRAEECSPAYQEFLAKGMTRALVAARAEEMSARTGCAVLCQLLQDMARVDGRVDRVLNGPTSEVWVEPWIDLLRGKHGVTFAPGHRVTGIHCAAGKVSGVTVESANGREEIHADYYVAAMPAEKLAPLTAGGLSAADPRLARVGDLLTRWMTGAMYYLDVDRPLVNGHVIFLNSPWALTAISQQQFWELDLENRGDGRVEGILSVDISDWDTKGSNGKAAVDCTKEEILDEVWKQMVAHIDDGSLDAANVLTRFLDPAIHFDPVTKKPTGNDDPLLINKKRSWANRPDAATAIPNFVIASDFVRTNTDLATMEGANEAARRAVNAILDAESSTRKRCKVYDLDEPALLAPFRAVDALLWKLGGRGPRLSLIGVNEAGNLVMDLSV
jgi:uncharacterized protein with NAD-binding domain and iron-sulfur cluster